MRIRFEHIACISNLAEGHTVLHFMAQCRGPTGYKAYCKNHPTLLAGVKAISRHLGVSTLPELPANRKEWLAANNGEILHRFITLLDAVRAELRTKFGVEGTEIYDYSHALEEFLWFSITDDSILSKEGIKSRIREKALRFGACEADVESFLTEPTPEKRSALRTPILQYFNYVVFFISYSQKNGKFVDELVEAIEGPQVRVWRDKKDIVAGDSISEKLEDAIRSCDIFCPCLSSKSVKSAWVDREYRAALNIQLATGSPQIIPILIERVPLPVFLRDIKYANFSTGFDAGFKELCAAIQSRRNARVI